MATLKNTTINYSVSTSAVTLPKGTTAQRPALPQTGDTRYNTNTNYVEYYTGTEWKNLSAGDGSSAANAAISASAIKRIVGDPSSGVYWLRVPNINSNNPFECYCDFSIDNGNGYAIITQQAFAGYQTGPTTTTMNQTTITGTAGYADNYAISPRNFIRFYNGGEGAQRLLMFSRSQNGTSAGGITSASAWRWVYLHGRPANIMADFVSTTWNNNFDSRQLYAPFVAWDDSRDVCYIPGGHGTGGGVNQWVAGNPTIYNTRLVFENSPNGGSDPNHYWMIGAGQPGDSYFRLHPQYGNNSLNNGALFTQYGGFAVY